MPSPLRAPILVLSLLAALAVSGFAAQASSAAAMLGSTLEHKPDTVDQCSNKESDRGCVAVNQAIPGRELAAPFDGVIVRWHARFGAMTQAQAIRIRVMRPAPSQEFKFITSGLLEPIPAGAGTYTFAASLPIAAGDQVGLEAESGKGIEYQATLPGSESFIFNPEGTALDGSLTGPPDFKNEGLEATFNVEVEPDCDHDGLGDETQDSDLPPACKPAPPTPAVPSNSFTLGKPKLNKKKGTAKEPVTVPGPGMLTLTGKAVSTTSLSVSTTGTVSLLVKLKGQRRRRMLKRGGSAKVTITVTYNPTGGTPSSRSTGLVLKKRLH